nr:glycosyltransferase family 2 protein [uncultured Flavobacterium sp.]
MLAIVIPYYKLTFFEETLQSLANQTDKRFKVYIGNDASPENPSDLLEKYKGNFDFVYHRFEANLGSISLVKQWDRCIAMIGKEEWLMILGDDDYLENTVVASWYENFTKFNDKSNVVRFACKLIIEDSELIIKPYKHPVWESATDSFYRKFDRISRSSLSEYIFLKRSYEKYGFYNYPLAWNSDDRAWLDFSENKPIYTINESLVYVRLSKLNITGKKNNLKLKDLSSVEFHNFIILNKLKYYNKFKRVKIIRKYHLELKKVKSLEIKDYFFLMRYYLININSYAIKKFLQKYLKT